MLVGNFLRAHRCQFRKVVDEICSDDRNFDTNIFCMLGHLAALIHSGPRSVLVVGFGAGVTAGSFTTYPTVRRIVICELEPLIPPVTTQYFAKENYGVLRDRRSKFFFDQPGGCPSMGSMTGGVR